MRGYSTLLSEQIQLQYWHKQVAFNITRAFTYGLVTGTVSSGPFIPRTNSEKTIPGLILILVGPIGVTRSGKF